MAINYTRMRSTAERLIEANGRTLQLVRRDQGNPTDPTKPWRTSTNAAEVTVSVLGVVISFEKDDLDGTLILRTDKRVLLAAKSVSDAAPSNLNIDEYDFLLDGTTRYSIINAEVLEPGSSRLLYDLHVRQ